MSRCPKCFSDDVKIVDYMGAQCIICRNCGFDETTLYEVYPSDKSSGKAKRQFSPYKAGGSTRTQVRK